MSLTWQYTLVLVLQPSLYACVLILPIFPDMNECGSAAIMEGETSRLIALFKFTVAIDSGIILKRWYGRTKQLSLILSWCFLPHPSSLYQAHQQPQGSLRFSYATFSVFLVLGLCTCIFFFSFLQCDVSTWWNSHINQFAWIHWIFNDDIWSVELAVIVLSVLTGMSNMMVMLLSLLCITVSGSCSYHLSVTSISWSLHMLQRRYAAALLCLEMGCYEN